MKHNLLFAFSLLISCFSHAANLRVNNTSGIDADFTTLQAAHDAASEGDSIYVEGSLTNYDNNGTVNISKRLVIIGPGYFLGQNPFTQAIKMTSNFNYINFIAGSEGSSVMGLMISRIDINSRNVAVRRNHITNAYVRSEDFLISQNYITSEVNGTNCRGIVVNNIIRQVTFNSNSSVSILNNVLYYSTSSYSAIQASNSEVRNNIIYDYSQASLFATSNNNTITNNIFIQDGTEADGNKFNVAVASIIVGTGSSDGLYQLSESSPAKGAGLNGVDCGPFGGDSPYVLSGIPPGPSIYEVNAPATASKAGGLTVSIKIYSHP